LYFNILKSDGYYRNGKVDKNYNTDGITRIVNITPKSISDEALNIDVFFVNSTHGFLMMNKVIYRYRFVRGITEKCV